MQVLKKLAFVDKKLVDFTSQYKNAKLQKFLESQTLSSVGKEGETIACSLGYVLWVV